MKEDGKLYPLLLPISNHRATHLGLDAICGNGNKQSLILRNFRNLNNVPPMERKKIVSWRHAYDANELFIGVWGPKKKMSYEHVSGLNCGNITTFIMAYIIGICIVWLNLHIPIVWPTVYTIMHDDNVEHCFKNLQLLTIFSFTLFLVVGTEALRTKI